MDYVKIYCELVEKRLLEPYDGEYSEKHHIIPKSIANDVFICSLLEMFTPNQLVIFSLREHFVAHRLLVKICQPNKNCLFKMLHALNLLQSRGASSHSYFVYKSQYSQMLSEYQTGNPSPAKGCKWSDESKQRRKDNHYMKGKTYEEIYGEEKAKELKELRRIGSTDKLLSAETKQKISEAAKNRTPEHREKLSLVRKGKPLAEETKRKLSEHFSNPDLNPKVHQTLYTFYNINTRRDS